MKKIVDLNTNETVYLAGDNPNGFSYLGRNISISNNFEDENSEFEVSGNPLSVVDSINYENITKMPGKCFTDLFAYSNVTSAKNLSLACSKLSINCYSSMFEGCEKLVEAPELPATTLADSCYSSMFFECSALINAPELPATSFNEDCVGCYECMFRGCDSLSQVKVGFGEGDIWPAFGVKGFTEKWLDEVSYLGTFEWKGSDNPTFTRGRNTIPTGWTIKPY